MSTIQKGADEKFCMECAAVIKSRAVICPKCGCPQTPAGVSGYAASSGGKNRNVAGLLALCLGGVGVHKFYLEKPSEGILYLVFCWTFIPALLALVDAIRIFGMTDSQFDSVYNSSATPS